MPQIDSVFVERYNVTLTDIDQKGARLLMVDLLEGQRAIEQIKIYEGIVKSQGQAISHLKGIIKTDSTQIVNLRIENKKFRRQSTLTKIGSGVAIIVGGILIFR
jgi:SNF2 family DNA or RNA helicase